MWNFSKPEQYQLYRLPCASAQWGSSSSLQNYCSGQEKGKTEAADSVAKRSFVLPLNTQYSELMMITYQGSMFLTAISPFLQERIMESWLKQHTSRNSSSLHQQLRSGIIFRQVHSVFFCLWQIILLYVGTYKFVSGKEKPTALSADSVFAQVVELVVEYLRLVGF